MGVCESDNSQINNYNKLKIDGEIKDISNDYLLNNSIQESIRNKYVIYESKIGEGSLGKIFIGRDKTGKQYAIKTIKKKKIRNGDLLLNEVKIGMKLNHPNILRIKEIFEDKKTISFVMDYCEDGDLLDFITKSPEGKLNDFLCIEIMIQILEALNYLHFEAKVCHRDLKPENFLINIDKNNKPTVKLIDFGVAQYLCKGQSLKGKVGTLKYMAPEIFIRESYNEKVDVWSAGVILYNMATGLDPITINEKESKKRRILNRNINFEEIKNEHIRKLCKEMLEKYPHKRINAKIALEKARSIKKILFNRHNF